MFKSTNPKSKIQNSKLVERLAVALLISLSVHIFIVFAVGFSSPDAPKFHGTTMDVILVQKRTEKVPDKANYLAQVSQEGGGESKEKLRPATPITSPFPDVHANIVATPPIPQVATAPKSVEIEKLTTQQTSEYKIEQHQRVTSPEKPAEQGNDLETTPETNSIPLNVFIMQTNAEIASIQAELNDKLEEFSKSPRKKYVTASTMESKYARYMEAWRRKVERYANLHYPKQVHRKKLSGQVILTVAINANGTIDKVEVLKTSGHKVLDDATLRLVHRAAPFAAFPKEIRKETDILYVTRTWEFSHGGLASW